MTVAATTQTNFALPVALRLCAKDGFMYYLSNVYMKLCERYSRGVLLDEILYILCENKAC